MLTWLGLTLSPQLGGPQFAGALALSTLAGLVQLVPELGPILGLLPAFLLLLVAPERAVTYLAAYIAARVIAGWLVGGRRVRSEVHVHPAILIPGVVVLGQIGFVLLPPVRRRSCRSAATSCATCTAACPSRRDRPGSCPASRSRRASPPAPHGRSPSRRSIAAAATGPHP